MVGSRLGGIPEIVVRCSAVAPPSPEKIVEAVAKVLETRYDREEMMRYVFMRSLVAVRRGFSLGVVSEVVF